MNYELGIVGGMGPLATSVLFDYIVRHTFAENDQAHINALILNHATLPDRTQVILRGKDDDFLDAVKGDFAILNNLQVPLIAFPCNTGHYFFDAMQAMADGDIINMVDETLARCQSMGVKKVAVFATKGTTSTKLYDRYAAARDLAVLYPTEEEQETITRVIYDVKGKGKTHFPVMDALITKYTEDAVVILACTELSTIGIDHPKVVDTTQVLGDVIIERTGRKRV
ncbi:MAG: amino acid racemase [Peptoniphilus sp.]|nr:amino acid racemase [Peptoniphilus sp.]MDY3118354.1 amino acid racemase [Peptoniphilus sp.]